MHAACSQDTRQKEQLVQTVQHLVEQRKQRNGSLHLRALEEDSGGEGNRLRDCR